VVSATVMAVVPPSVMAPTAAEPPSAVAPIAAVPIAARISFRRDVFRALSSWCMWSSVHWAGGVPAAA
jgi:hypothetical protein